MSISVYILTGTDICTCVYVSYYCLWIITFLNSTRNLRIYRSCPKFLKHIFSKFGSPFFIGYEYIYMKHMFSCFYFQCHFINILPFTYFMQIIRISFSHNLQSNYNFHSTEASSLRLCSVIHGFEGWQVDKLCGLKIFVLSLAFLFERWPPSSESCDVH